MCVQCVYIITLMSHMHRRFGHSSLNWIRLRQQISREIYDRGCDPIYIKIKALIWHRIIITNWETNHILLIIQVKHLFYAHIKRSENQRKDKKLFCYMKINCVEYSDIKKYTCHIKFQDLVANYIFILQFYRCYSEIYIYICILRKLSYYSLLYISRHIIIVHPIYIYIMYI